MKNEIDKLRTIMWNRKKKQEKSNENKQEEKNE